MLDIDQLRKEPFHSTRAKSYQRKLDVSEVLFPGLTLSTDGDKYFQNLWRTIDASKDFVWVLMYHFDDTEIGRWRRVKRR